MRIYIYNHILCVYMKLLLIKETVQLSKQYTSRRKLSCNELRTFFTFDFFNKIVFEINQKLNTSSFLINTDRKRLFFLIITQTEITISKLSRNHNLSCSFLKTKKSGFYLSLSFLSLSSSNTICQCSSESVVSPQLTDIMRAIVNNLYNQQTKNL